MSRTTRFRTTRFRIIRSRTHHVSADAVWMVLLVAPALLLVLTFVLLPAVQAVYASFFAFGLTSPDWTWVGAGNYIRALNDPVFRIALKNNLIVITGSIVFQVGLGTILAAVLDRGIPVASTLFRTIIFMPVVTSAVAVAVIWLGIYDPNVGVLNALVRAAGLHPPARGWLGDPDLAIWMILIVGIWQYTGLVMVIVLAGLQAIPREYYEAAALDGAGGIRSFFCITLPALRNVLLMVTLMTIIGGLKVFDLVYVLTGGGPANASHVIGTLTWVQAFNLSKTGYANAMSSILLVMAVIAGWIQLKSGRAA